MGAGLATRCCCKDGSYKVEGKKQRIATKDVASKESTDGGGQARAHLNVKTGKFSLGAFAASNRGQPEDFYQIEKKVIGEGSYGSVQKCQSKDTGQSRALKTINKSLVKNADQFKEEMAIMKLLDHPNIVRLHETFEDARNVYLVMELCTGGELFDRIVADGKFTEQAAASCVLQMLRAVNYMHQNYIMHRDLKPENWLLSSDASIQKTDLKLIDFGLSKRFMPGQFATTKAGTPYYVAPEVLEGRYAEQSDVWSIGVIMYIMLSGSPPFSGNDTVAVLDAVKKARPQFDKKEWKSISSDAKQLLKSLLQKNPATRVKASEALKHKWLTRTTPMDDDPGLSQVTPHIMGNLKSFAFMNKLKKASLNVIASQLTGSAIDELKKIFIAMDENNDGTLSVTELKEGLMKAGVSIPPDLGEMMDSLDTDGSGVIDYSEFMAATMEKQKYIQEDVCWRAFKTFDVDGSGHIDKEEVFRLLCGGDVNTDGAAEQEVETIMKEVDLNGDGKIDFEEFLAMMRKMPSDNTGKNLPIKMLQNIGIGRSGSKDPPPKDDGKKGSST
jgi:calcium-dependent protein kinase